MAVEKKEIKKIAALCLIAAAVAAVGTAVFYFLAYDFEIVRFDASAGDYVGINADKDMLHFGTGYPGSMLERELKFDADAWTEIRIWSTLDFAYAEVPDFALAPGEERIVKVYVSLPQGKFANYTGSFIIRQREARQ